MQVVAEFLISLICKDLIYGVQVREKMDKGLIPLHKFIITKQLTKRPEEYPDAQNQPHVQVALRRAKSQHRDGVAQARSASKPDNLPFKVT